MLGSISCNEATSGHVGLFYDMKKGLWETGRRKHVNMEPQQQPGADPVYMKLGMMSVEALAMSLCMTVRKASQN